MFSGVTRNMLRVYSLVIGHFFKVEARPRIIGRRPQK